MRASLEVADIFRAAGPGYRAAHAGHLNLVQLKVMTAIENCRTAALGGHVEACEDCGHWRIAYNSCRNRHCPKRQALAQARWIDRREAHILPVPHFHVVFTLPAVRRPLARLNRTRVFDALFAAVAATLQQLVRDPKRLGAMRGFTAVLHPWTRDRRFHPHVHCVVTAGGLACWPRALASGSPSRSGCSSPTHRRRPLKRGHPRGRISSSG